MTALTELMESHRIVPNPDYNPMEQSTAIKLNTPAENLVPAYVCTGCEWTSRIWSGRTVSVGEPTATVFRGFYAHLMAISLLSGEWAEPVFLGAVYNKAQTNRREYWAYPPTVEPPRHRWSSYSPWTRGQLKRMALGIPLLRPTDSHGFPYWSSVVKPMRGGARAEYWEYTLEQCQSWAYGQLSKAQLKGLRVALPDTKVVSAPVPKVVDSVNALTSRALKTKSVGLSTNFLKEIDDAISAAETLKEVKAAILAGTLSVD